VTWKAIDRNQPGVFWCGAGELIRRLGSNLSLRGLGLRVASRLRLGGAGEHVDSGSRDLVLGAVSHGSLRGIIDARVVWMRWVAVALVQVLESFSLSLVVRTLLMLIGVSCGLEINISWAVSYQGG
jgi:hypothetical protein